MTIVRVPLPPRSAMNRNRPVSTLLKNQIRHLQEAEFKLPAALQSDIYIPAIKTEREAGEYIQQVTAALHQAHADGVSRAKLRGKAGRVVAIAAAAEPAGKTALKKSAGKRKAKPAAKMATTKKKAMGKPRRKA